MNRRLARFLALAGPDRRLLVEAIIAQPLLRFALWGAGFKRCQAALSRLSPISRPGGLSPDAALEIAGHAAALVRSASQCGVLHRRCLTRSLTLRWLLRRRGIDSEICIGVRKVAGRLEAHAWVEHGGVVLGDDDDVKQRFAALAGPTIPRYEPAEERERVGVGPHER